MKSTLHLACAALAALAVTSGAPAAQEPAPMTYAIVGARVVPVSGPAIADGTVVFTGDRITAVGVGASVPAGAIRIDGAGLTVYPGLIDMGSTAGVAVPAAPRSDTVRTTEDQERAKRAAILRPHVRVADHVNAADAALERAAAAGITSVLALPPGDTLRGQSALLLTSIGADAPQIGAVADDRRAPMVVRSPVALHVSFAGRPGGANGYPVSLMGGIAFVRQAFLDAQHHGAAVAYAGRTRTAAPAGDAALDALQPALDGTLPVAFEAASAREILRALAMARAFSFTPMITNALEAGAVASDLRAANARVIVSLNFPARLPSLAPDADEPLETLRRRANAPKTPAALQTAGVPFAFASDGLGDPKDFLRHAAKAVAEGLPADAALRALTLQAATMAGAADRLGSIDAGKLANLVVTTGDLFEEKTTIAHVFVAGQPVTLDAADAGARRAAP
ncbi:MAG: amidohydrolase family protein [Vicinamibacterales bacterium]|nr:amidohydrolase family protein [Vicinamibacterales bacterium]